MDNLKTIFQLVKHILEKEPFCRNSDCFLELEVLKVYAKRQGLDLGSMTVDTLYKNRTRWGFPKSESIRRNRQLVQAKHPELAASDPIDAYRLAKEERVRSFVRGAKYDQEDSQ